MKRFKFVCASLAILLFCASLFAQTPARLAFEVASIKPSPPLSSMVSEIQSGKLDVRMRMDGARVDFKYMPLAGLLAQAYKVKSYQVSGPDWIKTQLFEIHAKLPEGSNKDQIPEMLQTLLAERFNLAFHREPRELPVYVLIVGKNGLKMKEVVEEPAAPVPAGKDTTAVRKMNTSFNPESGIRMEIPKIKMEDFVEMLAQFTDRLVLDRTELKGSYEVVLDIPLELKMPPKPMGAADPSGDPGASAPSRELIDTSASIPAGSSIFKSIQKLGLKLDSRKEPTEMIVVDSADKEPTEN
jgi:uncharacterized protein (TIGR03435 family)